MQNTCPNCKIEYHVKPSHAERRRFCSMGCRKEFTAKQNTKSCKVCGEEFQAQPSREKFGRGQVCSRECQYKQNSGAREGTEFVQRKCKGCGDEFSIYKSTLKSSKGTGKFCTRECRDKHWKGELNAVYQGADRVYSYGPNWQSSRRKALKAQKICQHCGTDQRLHVHHKIPIRLFPTTDQANDQRNLLVLCASCHRKEEAKSVWVNVPGEFAALSAIRMNPGGYAHQLAKEKGLLNWRKFGEKPKKKAAKKSGSPTLF